MPIPMLRWNVFSASKRLPKPAWETLTEEQQKLLQDLTEGNCITPRDSKEYQHLLFSEEDSHADDAPDEQQQDNGEEDKSEQSNDENDDTEE